MKRTSSFVCLALLSVAGCGPKNESTLPTNIVAADTPPPAAATGVLLEQSGDLGAGDLSLQERFVDDYEVQVAANQHISVRVETDALDTTLLVTAPGGRSHTNDDFGGSTRVSAVDFVASQAGTMNIRVSSYAPGATGTYRVRAEALAPDPAGPAGVMLAVGVQATGAIDANDPALREGRHADAFSLAGGYNRTISLNLRAQGFPASLSVFTPDGQSVGADTDAQGNATTTLSLATPGTYRVQVVEREAGHGGAYQLAVANVGGEAGGTQTNVTAAENRPHHNGLGAVQPAGTIAIGALQAGALARTDPHFQTGETVDAYTLQVAQPTRLMIDVESDQFDTYLIVVSPTGRVLEDDDGGDVGYNSRLVETLSDPGTYTIYATSYARGATGDYRLVVRPDSATQNPVNTPAIVTPQANPNVTRDGALAQGDTAREGHFVDTYDFQWTSGQRLELALDSTAFDTVLVVRAPSGAVETNDDFDPSAGTNSALTLNTRESGRYQVAVTSYGEGQVGPYSLRVREGGGQTNTPVNPTNGNPATLEGRLDQSDPAIDGRHRDSQQIQLPAGRVHVGVSSAAFDPMMTLEGPSGYREENDDEQPPARDAGITLNVPAAGTYRLFVTSYDAGGQGPYRVSISQGGGTVQPNNPNNPPTSGGGPETFQGALARGDADFGGGRFSDSFARTWPAGVTRTVAVASTEFDTVVSVRSPSGRTFDNDDVAPGSNTNSLVTVPVGEAGEWHIVVSSYEPGATGSYTVGVTEGAAGPGPGPGPGPHVGGGPRVFGIFAGITDYGGRGNLPECANDAIKLAEELRTTGVQQPSQQIVLTDAQVTPQGITNAFRQMAGAVGPNDVFLFFYSGHGGQTDRSSDQRELDSRDEYIYIRDGQVTDDEMSNLFDSIHAGTAVIALDSCFSGGFAKDVISRPGRMGFFSSEEDLTSAVAGAFQAGGYLSYFLRTGMGGEADAAPRDGRLTAGELSHYLQTQFGQHVTNVDSSTMDDLHGFQHLVVDRGAVRVDNLLLAY